MRENPETSGVPGLERGGGRSAKAPSHKADAHAPEESDPAIVSMNQANKEEQSLAGGWGKKGVGQGEHRFVPRQPRLSAGNECSRDGAVCESHV
jgi:hypothetical protein